MRLLLIAQETGGVDKATILYYIRREDLRKLRGGARHLLRGVEVPVDRAALVDLGHRRTQLGDDLIGQAARAEQGDPDVDLGLFQTELRNRGHVGERRRRVLRRDQEHPHGAAADLWLQVGRG